MRPLLVVFALTVLFYSSDGFGAGLRSHTALYDMKKKAQYFNGLSNVDDVEGVLRYKFVNGCNNWTVEHQTALILYYSDGQEAHLSWHYESVEDKEGNFLDFKSQMGQNDQLGEMFVGRAVRENEAITVSYTQPVVKTEILPSATLFPTQYLLKTFESAHQGKSVFSSPYFDGNGGQLAFQVDSAISKSKVQLDETLLENKEKLVNWDVDLAFYEVDSTQSVSDTNVKLTYREDGVTLSVLQEFGEFFIDGSLSTIVFHEEEKCN